MKGQAALKAAFQRKAVEGKIRGMVAKVYSLAPHPDRPDFKGPVLISLKSHFKPAAEYDGMLGSMMVDMMLGDVIGQALGSASNDNPVLPIATTLHHLDLDDLGELFSEYLQSREKQKKSAEKGQGTFALGEHKSICNLFNDNTEEAMTAYTADLPKRMRLEQAINTLSKKADLLRYKETLAEPRAAFA
jgi:hypothetical protein